MSATSIEARTAQPGGVLPSISAISRSSGLGDRADRPGRDLGVERGRRRACVAEQHLDDADIDVLLEQVGGEAVTQRVRADALADAGDLGGLLDGAMQLPRRDRIGAAAAREQPAMRKHHPAPPAFAPPQPQQFEQLRREHRVAILAALALLDTEQHALAVDVVDLEVRDLGHAQARAIGDAERGLVLEARCGFEQPRRFLDAEHIRQLAVIARDHQGARQIPPLQCHQEQEPQRRDSAVDGRRSDALLMLIELEAADILRRRGVGRAAEKRGKAPDVTNVVLLRVGAEAPHEHVVLHALAKRRNGCIGRRGSHGEFLSLKGTPWSARPPPPAQRLRILRHLRPRRPSREAGSCMGALRPFVGSSSNVRFQVEAKFARMSGMGAHSGLAPNALRLVR